MYKKKIKRGSKLYSYYYHNIKEKGRVKNIFLADNKKEALEKLSHIRNDHAHKILLGSAPTPVSKGYSLTYYIVLILAFAIGFGFFYFNNKKTT